MRFALFAWRCDMNRAPINILRARTQRNVLQTISIIIG